MPCNVARACSGRPADRARVVAFTPLYEAFETAAVIVTGLPVVPLDGVRRPLPRLLGSRDRLDPGAGECRCCGRFRLR